MYQGDLEGAERTAHLCVDAAREWREATEGMCSYAVHMLALVKEARADLLQVLILCFVLCREDCRCQPILSPRLSGLAAFVYPGSAPEPSSKSRSTVSPGRVSRQTVWTCCCCTRARNLLSTRARNLLTSSSRHRTVCPPAPVQNLFAICEFAVVYRMQV